MFSKEEKLRYAKQTIVNEIGLLGQARLKDAKIAVIGAGGLGCPIIQYLASCGVGTIGIVEFDSIELSNLNRQILYTPAEVGQKKGKVSQQKVLDQNPAINVILIDEKIDIHNAETILQPYDMVIDGSDNFETRYTVNDACVTLGKPLVYGSILGFQGQLAVFNHNGSKNLRDLFTEMPNPEDVPSCAENGVLGVIPGIVGTLMANEAMKCVMDLPVLHNQFVIIDLLTLQFTHLNY
jgi:adenylyltransferase/sulfurtransferase